MSIIFMLNEWKIKIKNHLKDLAFIASELFMQTLPQESSGLGMVKTVVISVLPFDIFLLALEDYYFRLFQQFLINDFLKHISNHKI